MAIEVRLTTRCPHCDTAFRVYEQQLVKREGKVRCGACGNVFDAYETLETNADPMAIDGPASLVPGEHDATVSVGVARPTREVDLPLGEPQPSVPASPASPASASNSASGAEAHRPSIVTDSVGDSLGESLGESSDYVSQDGGHYDFGPTQPRGLSRWLLMAGSVLLGVAFLGQAFYWFRDDLAARFPPVAPIAEGLCWLVGCTIALPRVADQLESTSDLLADRNLLILTATIRNRASFMQAYPSLQLT
ncbi:MAG: DUF3426 domain-containing protein, partial [Burkholderiales bacterium]